MVFKTHCIIWWIIETMDMDRTIDEEKLKEDLVTFNIIIIIAKEG